VTAVLVVAAIIAAATTAGILAEPRLPDGGRALASVLTRALLWGLMPVLYYSAVSRLELSAGVGVGIAFAYLEIGLVGLAAWWISTRVLHLARPAVGAVLVCVVVVNTGYVGLPLTTALLGSNQLPFAITFDSAVSAPMFLIVAMAIGAVMGTTSDGTRAQQVRALAFNPPLWAVVLGLLAPDALAPAVLDDISHAAVYVLIPFGFFLVGLSLGSESEEGSLTFPPALTAPVVTVLVLRLLVAPALMLGLALLVHDVPDAYLLQAAMSCGANSVVVAHLYGLDLRIASSAVAWSTMLVLVSAIVAAPLIA